MIIVTSNVQFLGISAKISGHQGEVLTRVLGRLARLDAMLQVLESVDRGRANQLNETQESRRERFALFHQIANFLFQVRFETVEEKELCRLIVVLVIDIIQQQLGSGLRVDGINRETAMFFHHINHNGRVNWVRNVGDGVHSGLAQVLPDRIFKG